MSDARDALAQAIEWAERELPLLKPSAHMLPAHEHLTTLIAAARAQAERGAVAEGVPREPTQAMIDIGRHFVGPRERVAGFWQAMYDAAPRASAAPLPDVIERACAWLRSLQFGQPDAYNCADLLEQAARHAATEYTRGAEDMREAAAKHIERGRIILDIQVAPELMRDGNPAAVVQLISADAEAATRQRIVQVIRALPLPEPPA